AVCSRRARASRPRGDTPAVGAASSPPRASRSTGPRTWPGLLGRALAGPRPWCGRRDGAVHGGGVDDDEIDLAPQEVDVRHLHQDAVPQPERPAGVLADEPVTCLVVHVEIVVQAG